MSARRIACLVFLGVLIIVIVALLAGCLPALAPTIERLNGDVEVVVIANQPVWDVSVTIVGAVTDDPRCTLLSANGYSDSWCWIGDVTAGERVIVRAWGERASCTAAGYVEDDRAIRAYRPFACRVAGL